MSLGEFEQITALHLLRELNEADEHTRCEAKTSRECGRSLLETICAFSNEPRLGGGYILAGAAKKEKVLWPTYDIVGVDDPDTLQANIATSCRTEFNRPIRPQIRVETVRGRTALVVFVPEVTEAEKPIYFVKDQLPRGAYRRIGSTDQRCSEDDLLIFYRGQQIESFDKSVIPDGTMDDIDPDAIQLYRDLRSRIKSEANELAWEDDELLHSLSCCRTTKEGLKPTIAGVILFGRQKALRRCFPMMRIDYVRVAGTEWVENPEKRFDTVEIRLPLVQAVQRIHSVILDDLPKRP